MIDTAHNLLYPHNSNTNSTSLSLYFSTTLITCPPHETKPDYRSRPVQTLPSSLVLEPPVPVARNLDSWYEKILKKTPHTRNKYTISLSRCVLAQKHTSPISPPAQCPPLDTCKFTRGANYNNTLIRTSSQTLSF